MRANCPSCGAGLEFRSKASLYAVCASCSSFVLRHDLDVERLGQVSQLHDDGSPLRLGTRGAYKGRRFELVGRIQLEYAQGYWNEWYLLFDDGRDGWLGEAHGLYGVSFLATDERALPSFESLRPLQKVPVGAAPFVVKDLQRARCVGGEGELPFRIESGYEAPVADLASPGQAFATIDYSEDPPLVFVGQWLDFAELSFSELRERENEAGRPLPLESFGCPSCGAALERSAGATLVVACPYCEAVVDATHPAHALLARYEAKTKLKPEIPLGSVGTLRGERLTAIGFLEKRVVVEGVAYHWREYLLFHPRHGYRWLVEYDHHWTLLAPCMAVPSKKDERHARLFGREYRHFQTAESEVTYAIGEFNWQVRRGERVRGSDWVAPPYLFSEEQSEGEVSWSAGEYLPGAEVHAAFALPADPRAPVGIHAAQPNPREAEAPAMRRAAQLLLAGLLVVQFGSCALAKKELVLRESLQVSATDADKTRSTQTFELTRGGNLELELATDLENQWAYIQAALISPEHEEVFELGRSIEYYYGPDWSEGDRRDQALFGRVPAGRWALQLEVESPAPVLNFQLTLRRDVPRYAYALWAALLVLGPWLLFEYRRFRFEIQRWMESDHPIVTSSGEEDDDG